MSTSTTFLILQNNVGPGSAYLASVSDLIVASCAEPIFLIYIPNEDLRKVCSKLEKKCRLYDIFALIQYCLMKECRIPK